MSSDNESDNGETESQQNEWSAVINWQKNKYTAAVQAMQESDQTEMLSYLDKHAIDCEIEVRNADRDRTCLFTWMCHRGWLRAIAFLLPRISRLMLYELVLIYQHAPEPQHNELREAAWKKWLASYGNCYPSYIAETEVRGKTHPLLQRPITLFMEHRCCSSLFRRAVAADLSALSSAEFRNCGSDRQVPLLVRCAHMWPTRIEDGAWLLAEYPNCIQSVEADHVQTFVKDWLHPHSNFTAPCYEYYDGGREVPTAEIENHRLAVYTALLTAHRAALDADTLTQVARLMLKFGNRFGSDSYHGRMFALLVSLGARVEVADIPAHAWNILCHFYSCGPCKHCNGTGECQRVDPQIVERVHLVSEADWNRFLTTSAGAENGAEKENQSKRKRSSE